MTMLNEIRQSQRSVRIVWPVLALFALRAIVPVGYMPAAIGDGGPFVLCHSVSAATLTMLGEHDSMHGSTGIHGTDALHDGPAEVSTGNPAGSHDERWERCELGMGSASAAMAAALPEFVVAASPAAAISLEAGLPVSLRAAAYRARAPPA